MKEQELIFCCCCCGLPKFKPEDADRITHGIHIGCLKIEYPEEYKQMCENAKEVSDGCLLGDC